MGFNAKIFDVKTIEYGTTKLTIFGKTWEQLKSSVNDFGDRYSNWLNDSDASLWDVFFPPKLKQKNWGLIETQFNAIKSLMNNDGMDLKGAAGTVGHLDSALKELCDSGELVSMSFEDVKEKLGSTNKTSTLTKIGLNALSVAGNILATVVIEKLIEGVYLLATYQKRLAESAQEAANAYHESISELEDFKSQVDAQNRTINDSSVTYEKASEARGAILDLQNQMIEKYASETVSIETITAAINGEADAWKELEKSRYQIMKEEFEQEGSWFDRAVHGSNFEAMKYNMENSSQLFRTSGDKALDELIASMGATSTSVGNKKGFVLTGTLEEVYNKMLDIQTLATQQGLTEYANSLEHMISDLGTQLRSYESMYDLYLENERIFQVGIGETKIDMSKDLKAIEDAYAEYEEAFKSGDAKAIEEAKAAYVRTVNAGMEKALKDGIDDTAVANYLNTLHEDLELEVSKYRLNIALDLDTSQKNDFEKKVTRYLSYFESSEELLKLNLDNATYGQKEAWTELNSYATEFGLTLEQLIAYLEELGLIQPQALSDLVEELFPDLPEEKSGGFFKNIKDWIFNKENPEKTNDEYSAENFETWFADLDTEEKNFASTEKFERAVQARIEALNGAILTANDYKEILKEVSKVEEKRVTAKASVEQLFAIGDAKKEILSQLEEFEKGGNVNLKLRPVIDTQELINNGWDIDPKNESKATVFTSTFSNYNPGEDLIPEQAKVAVNFTPIIADPETGEYIGTLSPDELQKYAEEVLHGVHGDYLKLQIGAQFTGEEAIAQAEAAAQQIHIYHEALFTSLDKGINTESVNEIKNDLIGMAQAGKLDENTLQSYERFDELIKMLYGDANVTEGEITQLVNSINQMATQNPVDYMKSYTSELAKLEESYTNFASGKRITGDQLSALQDVFGDLPSYKEYEQVILTGNGDIQESYNKIATELAEKKEVLKGLTRENQSYWESEMEAAGITNAHAVAEDYLGHAEKERQEILKGLNAANNALDKSQQDLAISSEELESATVDELKALVQLDSLEQGNEENTRKYIETLKDEGKLLWQTSQAFAFYMIQKQYAEQPINTAEDIAALEELCNRLGVTGELMRVIVHLKGLMDAQAMGAPVESGIAIYEKRLDELMSGEYKPEIKWEYGGTKSDVGSAGKEAGDAYVEAFEKELETLETLRDQGKITEKEYLDYLRQLYERYFKDREEYLDKYKEYEDKYLRGKIYAPFYSNVDYKK